MIFKELYIHRSRMIKFAIVSIAFATRLLSYLLKLRTNGPNNSQHSQHCCWANNVGNYRVCVGTGVQQLPIMLGPAAVHLGKDTTLRLVKRACVAPTCSNGRIQHCCATLWWSQKKIMLAVVGLKVWPASSFAQQLPATRNNMQQDVQTDATCNIQHC